MESKTQSASLAVGAHPGTCNNRDDSTASAPMEPCGQGQSNQEDDEHGVADDSGNCSEKASSGQNARVGGEASEGESDCDKSVDKELEQALEAKAHARVGVLELDEDLDVDSDGGESSSKAAARAELSDKLIHPNTSRGRDGVRGEE